MATGKALTQVMIKGVSSAEGARQLAREGRTGVKLPEAVLKLTEGYELRVYWFEIVECGRKLALTGMPVWFEMGSVAQLTFGMLICFFSFGASSFFGLAGAAAAPLLSLSFFLILVALTPLSLFGLGGFTPLSPPAGFGFFGTAGAASFAFAAFSSRSFLITQIGLSSSESDAASAMAANDLSVKASRGACAGRRTVSPHL